MSAPLVSIIMPTFNRSDIISESIQSVVDQTYPNWSLIIIDDGSDDDTQSKVESFKNPRISYQRFDHSGSLGKLRNAGLKLATGEYVAFLDSDDVWRTDKLQLQLDFFKRNDIGYTFSNAWHFGPHATGQPPDLSKEIIIGDLFLDLIERQRFPMYLPSLMLRKSALKNMSLLDESLKTLTDIDFIYRLALKNRGAFSNERLLGIRKHDGMSKRYEDLVFEETVKVLTSIASSDERMKTKLPSWKAKYCYMFGMQQLNRNAADARSYFSEYLRVFPLHYKGWIRLAQSTLRSMF